MIEAYVLIQTKIGKLESVASEASRIGRVATAAVIAGPYDVIVRVSAEDLDSLGRQVVSEIQVMDGVTRTLTCPILHLGMGDHNTGVAGHRHHPRRLTPPPPTRGP